ncbi:MAG: hypothetical protein QOI26_1765 [Pseudonocardiales bacterium]|nr:hypothetical protein [Pseudonocardiales bacterium]
MGTLNYRTASAAAVFISVALLAAGCSSSKGSGNGGVAHGGGAGSASSATSVSSSAGGAGSTATTTSSFRSGAAAMGTAVTATEKEFTITLSATTFKAGAYVFTVHNTGKFPHNLTIEGPGVDKKTSPTMPGGGTGTVAATLQKGSYELWCSVDSHKDQGMDLTIKVS